MTPIFPLDDGAPVAPAAALRSASASIAADFSDLARLAAAACGAPMAIVSGVEGTRQAPVGSFGLELRQVPRDAAFCGRAVLGGKLLAIHDTLADERCASHSLVTGSARVRSVTSMPVVAATEPGSAAAPPVVAVVSVFDRAPRTLNEREVELLEAVARQIGAQIELRRVKLQGDHDARGTRTRQLLDLVPPGILVASRSGVVEYMNDSARRIVRGDVVPGVPVSQLVRRAGICIAGTDLPYPDERLPITRALRGEHAVVSDIELRRPEGSVPIQLQASPVFDAHGRVECAIAAFEDIRELRRQSSTDQLTGLLNRAAFRETFEHMARHCERAHESLTLAILDLDYFKEINDAHGHCAGDQVLTQFAAFLRTELRKSDTVARWGGEEFVVMFPNTDVRGAKHALEALLAELHEDPPKLASGTVIPITFSAGLAAHVDGSTLDELTEVADRRLYVAKAAGRARVVDA